MVTRHKIAKGILICLISIIGIVSSFSYIYLTHIYSFLAYKKVIDTETAIVEGWIGDSQIAKVANLILSNNAFERVIVTGDKIEFAVKYFPADNYAEIGALRLADCGISESKIILCSFNARKNRTLNSASYAKPIIEKEETKSFVIFTYDIHARRTYASYKKVFGNRYKIGIIPLYNGIYNSKNWYKSSEGMKEIIVETVAYLYFKFALLFRIYT